MAKLKVVLAMLIFGTIGIFVRCIPLPSELIALSRAAVGTLFLGAVILLSRRPIDWAAARRNAPVLLLSGGALGFNWILLFEAYRYTTVAVATLCYYMVPVFVILLSPLVLKERLTLTRGLCSAAAVAGAVLISGAAFGGGDVRGILFGLAAAMLYCGIVLMNRFLRSLSGLETTFLQLAVSAVVLAPYVALRQGGAELSVSLRTGVLLAVVGVVHTGIAYLLYFSSIPKMTAQTAAVFSYIDPVTAIVLSALVLKQPMTALQLAGTILILGATLANELLPAFKKSPANP